VRRRAALRARWLGLEVFATGLRNPQELVFDAWGNLFTGDNNSDGGDRARLVQVVEGGDSGWRQSYQWITEPALRGPWNDEKLWQPHFEGQAAYIVPPIANFADGPSGLTIDPGTGFPEAYRGQLFLCDFRGDAGSSGVHSIELEPRGAGFGLKSSAHLLWKVLATDCDFGPDGALYVTDWVQGWAQPGKGRLYRVYEPSSRASPASKATRQLLADGVQVKNVRELVELLSFADQRVRQEAQLELARRGEPARAALEQTARIGTSLLARVHALWALGIQLRQRESASTDVLLALLADHEAEVRAQAAHVLGDLCQARAAEGLVHALGDESARVRLYAALGLGRLRDPKAVPALLQLARETKDADPVLRHAAIQGLAGCASDATLAALASDPDRHARLAAVVALRRHAAPEIARFLADPEVLVAPRPRAPSTRCRSPRRARRWPRCSARTSSATTISPGARSTPPSARAAGRSCWPTSRCAPSRTSARGARRWIGWRSGRIRRRATRSPRPGSPSAPRPWPRGARSICSRSCSAWPKAASRRRPRASSSAG
jgi:quinoprotein glucose dehydrogenase